MPKVQLGGLKKVSSWEEACEHTEENVLYPWQPALAEPHHPLHIKEEKRRIAMVGAWRLRMKDGQVAWIRQSHALTTGARSVVNPCWLRDHDIYLFGILAVQHTTSRQLRMIRRTGFELYLDGLEASREDAVAMFDVLEGLTR